MNQSDRGEAFYALHHRGEPFVMPNPWDAGSARIMQAKGFLALGTTSVGVDHAGGRVSGSIGRDAILANIQMISEAVDLPVSADLEDCYGNDADGIGETIQLAAAAGAVGGSIEDAVRLQPGTIYPFEEAVARVAAAVEAAAALPFRFTLCARCENFLFPEPDMADTLARLRAYADAGADLVYAPGLRTRDEVEQVVNAVDKPVNVLLGLSNTTLDMADMHKLGVARVSLGSGIHRAAMRAALDALDEIVETGTFSFTSGLPGAGVLDRLLK